LPQRVETGEVIDGGATGAQVGFVGGIVHGVRRGGDGAVGEEGRGREGVVVFVAL
jgi:hypothetical protein